MKNILTAAIGISLTIALLSPAYADEASHKAAAGKLLEVTNSSGTIKTGFFTVIDRMISGMKQQGIPEAGAAEVRKEVEAWYAAEIKWDELQPQMADLYVKEFTEAELAEMLAFYATPTGKKTIEKMPDLMQKGAGVGQNYFTSKSASLNERIKPIIEKYAPKKDAAAPSKLPGGPGAPSAPAPAK